MAKKVLTPQKSMFYLTLTGTVIIAVIVIHVLIVIGTPANKRDDTLRKVVVERGSTFGEIADALVEAGVIKKVRGFRIAGKLVGAEKKVHAGEYELSASMSPSKIVNELLEGNVKRYNVTFPEGFDIRGMTKAIDEAGLDGAKGFLEFALDPDSAAELGLPGPTLEGYLFPDTYDFTRGFRGKDIARQMAARFKSVYDEERKKAGGEITLGLKEIATLASIIEKETGAIDEMPTISAVFHNRLRRGIALQSDPTVIYGILHTTGTFDGNLTRAHLTTDTPYNTYTRRGLPPGPIASPGKEAIRAALNPANVDYLYFVSKNDGTHKFSKNLTEHNRAVDKYQKRR